MKTRSTHLLMGCTLGLLCAIHAASAQSFSIDWHAIGGGGGTSTNEEFSVSGTIGQPDASPEPMTGGDFSLTGGFWSVIALQTPAAPLLSVQRLGTDARIFWPISGSDFLLDQSPAPTGAWSPVVGPYATNATHISITVPAWAGNRFYRLRKP